jgi:hypothetical protein
VSGSAQLHRARRPGVASEHDQLSGTFPGSRGSAGSDVGTDGECYLPQEQEEQCEEQDLEKIEKEGGHGVVTWS